MSGFRLSQDLAARPHASLGISDENHTRAVLDGMELASFLFQARQKTAKAAGLIRKMRHGRHKGGIRQFRADRSPRRRRGRRARGPGRRSALTGVAQKSGSYLRTGNAATYITRSLGARIELVERAPLLKASLRQAARASDSCLFRPVPGAQRSTSPRVRGEGQG
jgi:hypothetical protein